MRKQSNITIRLLILISLLLAASLACSQLGGETSEGQPETSSTEQPYAPPAEGAPSLAESPYPSAGDASSSSGTSPYPAAPEGEQSDNYDTEFPLPDDLQNFTSLGEGKINFQTNMSLQEVVDFYLQTFTAQGLTEEKILTSITDTTFSMVFKGSPNGKDLVIQGVDLGSGTTNVNIRYE